MTLTDSMITGTALLGALGGVLMSIGAAWEWMKLHKNTIRKGCAYYIAQ